MIARWKGPGTVGPHCCPAGGHIDGAGPAAAEPAAAEPGCPVSLAASQNFTLSHLNHLEEE